MSTTFSFPMVAAAARNGAATTTAAAAAPAAENELGNDLFVFLVLFQEKSLFFKLEDFFFLPCPFLLTSFLFFNGEGGGESSCESEVLFSFFSFFFSFPRH